MDFSDRRRKGTAQKGEKKDLELKGKKNIKRGMKPGEKTTNHVLDRNNLGDKWERPSTSIPKKGEKSVCGPGEVGDTPRRMNSPKKRTSLYMDTGKE